MIAFISIRRAPSLDSTDVNCFIPRNDHIHRAPVHRGTSESATHLIYDSGVPAAPFPRGLIDKNSVRSYDEQVNARRVLCRFSETKASDGLCRRFVNDAGFGK